MSEEHRSDRRKVDERAIKLEERSLVNRNLIDILAVGVFVLLLLVGGVAGIAWWAASNVQELEIKNRDTNRATAFRLCTRNKVDRAFAHARIRGYDIDGFPINLRPPPSKEQQDALNHASELLMSPPLLPILDCDPNLRGKGARPLPIKDQIDFVRRYARGDLTPGEAGVCPESVIGQPTTPQC